MPLNRSIALSLALLSVSPALSQTREKGMVDPNFWPIIDASRQDASDDPDRQLAQLDARLGDLGEEELLAFIQSYAAAHETAYRWDLWGAAYVINGGASDDGFAYFRDWLISQGKVTYEAALADPEILIDYARPYETEFEEFRYVAIMQYMSRFGAEPDFYFDPSGEPIGEPFDEDTVFEKFPKLAKWVDAGTE